MSYYHLTLRATVQSQLVVNTFDYVTTSILPSSEEAAELNAEFIGQVLPDIRNVLSTQYIGVDVYTIAPYSPDVFAQTIFTPGSQNGGRSGEMLPRYNAWGFVISRLRRDIRNGYKRFGSISETDQSGGAPTAAMATLLNTLANELEQVLTLEYVAGSSAASPIVVKRIKYNPDPEKPDEFAYRLPQGTDPFEFYEATQISYQTMTTQNTRKTGRGA